jgi:hypothetical protein
MPEPKSTEINGCKYTLAPVGYRDARDAWIRILNVIGPALETLEKYDAKASNDVGVSAAAIGRLIAKLTPEDLDFVERKFAAYTTIRRAGDAKSPQLSDVMEMHFSGENCTDAPLWLAFCISSTYARFFDALRTRLAPWLARFAAAENTGATEAS